MSKWANVSAGPRQVKDLQRAMSALLSEGKTHNELAGVVGGGEHQSALVSMCGPVRAEVTALDEAIREKYAHQVTRENVRAIIADYQAAMPEACKSRPTEDNRRTPEDEAQRLAASAERDAKWQAKQEAESAIMAQVMAKAPRSARALIYAEYHEDTSDPMTDYYGSRVVRTVAIGFRTGSREDFRHLRAAAGQYPETAHLATMEDAEHRENYSMGGGNFLSDHRSSDSGTGWVVRSRAFPCQYVALTEDAIPDKPATPEARPVGTSAGRAVSGDVLDVLSRATTDGNALRMTDRLDRATYVAVNEVLSAAGGKWNRKARAHLFPGDAAPILAQLLEGRTYRTAADDGWFPTPPAIVARMLDAAGPQPGMDVLEPSAGEGAIAWPAAARGCEVDCVELDEHRAAVIEAAGYAGLVKVADFLTLDPEPAYDRVLMNPPFAGKADIHHVTHALKFLRPGGLLVAIMAAGVQFREDRLTEAFCATVEERGGTIETLPDDSFRESGTGVRTVLVTIPAPAAASATRLVVDGKALRLERDGRTLGRISATAGKLATGEGRFIFWASTPAGAMTPHASQDEAAQHLVSQSA